MNKLTVFIVVVSICAINGFHLNFFHREGRATKPCGETIHGGVVGNPTNCNAFSRCYDGTMIELTCPMAKPHFHPCDLTCVAGDAEICVTPCNGATTPTTTTTVAGGGDSTATTVAGGGDTSTTTTAAGGQDTTTTTTGEEIPTPATQTTTFNIPTASTGTSTAAPGL